LTTVSGIFNYSCQSGKQITELSEVFRAHSSPVGGLEMDERVVFSYERNRSCGSSSEKLEMTREHLVLIFHKACLWDRKSGKLLRRFEHHAPVSHIRLLGHRVVIVYSNVVRFFFVFSFLSIRFLFSFFFFMCFWQISVFEFRYDFTEALQRLKQSYLEMCAAYLATFKP
jgi:hypothetical protein